MHEDIHIRLGDAALTSWGERVVRDMDSGIGYPSSTAEGRARRDGLGKSGKPASAIVPRLVEWSEQDMATDNAVRSAPVQLSRLARTQYVDGLVDKQAIEKWKSQRGMFDRRYYQMLRELRVWVAGWLARDVA